MTARSLGSALNPLGLLIGVALIALWQVLVDAHVLHYEFLPSPSEVASGLADLAGQAAFWDNLVHTTVDVLIAWGLSLAIGIAIGFAVGLSQRAWDWTMASFDVLRAIPSVAFIPVVILVVGPSSEAEIIVAAYAGVWSVLITAAGGAQAASPRLHDVAATFQLSRAQRIRKIVLPSAVPTILVGARIALTITLVVTIVTEMLGPPIGLGYGLIQQAQALQTERTWGYVVVIGVLGLVLNAAFNGLVRWRLRGFAPLLGAREA